MDLLMPVHLAVQMTWRPVDLVKDSHPIRAVTFDSKDRQTYAVEDRVFISAQNVRPWALVMQVRAGGCAMGAMEGH